jgi:N-acetylmuramoyl-L-alanine amidase
MRKKKFTLFALLFSAILVFAGTTALADEYTQYEAFADSDFSHAHDVCIDPGHGGPYAQKFGNNGDGAGTHGCCYNLSEQWVNLQVAYALEDSLYPFCNCPGQIVFGVIMTREGWTDIAYGTDGLRWRVFVANYANMGGPVHEFLSIHHNGFPDSSDADQGTESWWWNCDTTGSGATRDTTSKLARKVKMKVRYGFNAAAECYECYDDRPTLLTDKYVLRNSRPASVLSEASDIHLPSHWKEELLFMDSTTFWHATVEAGGIVRGWCSYKNNSGFVTIRNSAITGSDGYLYTDWGEWGKWIQWDSPYYTVWEMDEYWRIKVPAYQYIGDGLVYFHHIEELEHGYYSTDQILDYVVPQCSTHTIVAYWTGGPYSVDIFYPAYWHKWEVGQLAEIRWEASSGADSTSLIDILLSRNGGSSWETIAINIPFDTLLWYGCGRYYWMVDGVTSSNCKVLVRAHDWAGNLIEDTSDVFPVVYNATVEHPPSGVEWQIGNSVSIQWTASPGQDSTSLVDICLSRNGGSTWQTLLTNIPFDTIPAPYNPKGRVYWMVSGNTSNNCRIRIRAHDSAGNNTEVVSNQFPITYKLELLSSEDLMCVGWVWWIRWRASPGEDSSTVVDFYLSRDGGEAWPEYLGTRAWMNPGWLPGLPGEDTVTWLVTPPSTNHGKIRLYAHDSYGHTAADTSQEFTVCGGCIRGDIVKDGKYYLVTDAVVFAWWFVDSSDVCDPDPVYGISPCDVNCDGRVSLGDLIYLVRVICGDFSPCDTGPPYEPGPPPYAGEIEVKANDNTISISSAYPTSALAFDFNEEVEPVLIAANMQIQVNNGKVLVWNLNGDTIPPGTHDILAIPENVQLVSVRAADNEGREFKANITAEMTTPSRYALFQNYPNPFNPNTWVSFTLPNAIAYTLKIYNLSGQLVRSYERMGVTGLNTIFWDGRSNTDESVSSGIYFYRLQAGEYNDVRKMLMLK